METNTETKKVLYTGKTNTTGGREGASHSSDGRLDGYSADIDHLIPAECDH
jgi:organic hydroperoxide reductase OsmC/OhrA